MPTGTNPYVPDKVIQAILRHSHVSVTLGYYIKPQSADEIAAMGKFEAEIAAHNFRGPRTTFFVIKAGEIRGLVVSVFLVEQAKPLVLVGSPTSCDSQIWNRSELKFHLKF